MLLCRSQIVQVGALNLVVVVVVAAQPRKAVDCSIDDAVLVLVGVAVLVLVLVVRLGAQCRGEVEHVVVYGALELTQCRDEGGLRVLCAATSVKASATTTVSAILTGELAGGIMTTTAPGQAQLAWPGAVVQCDMRYVV